MYNELHCCAGLKIDEHGRELAPNYTGLGMHGSF
jgi:hypothetical protein